MRKYYHADVYSEKNGVLEYIDEYIVVKTVFNNYREILTGKRVGFFSEEGEPRQAKGKLLSEYDSKEGSDYSTLYVDKGSLVEIHKEHLKTDLAVYSERNAGEMEMLFLRTAIMNGEEVRRTPLYYASISSFTPGFKDSYYGKLDRYEKGKGVYIVAKTKKGYRELLTGEEFGYFKTVSEECPMDGMPFIGYGMYPSKEHPSMLVEEESVRRIDHNYLQKSVMMYSKMFDIKTLKLFLRLQEESYKCMKKVLQPGNSIELDER